MGKYEKKRKRNSHLRGRMRHGAESRCCLLGWQLELLDHLGWAYAALRYDAVAGGVSSGKRVFYSLGTDSGTNTGNQNARSLYKL